MPAPRAACSARRSAFWLRETSPKAMPSRTRMSHQSMPSLRPFSHKPPSEIGVSFFLNSVLYERTGVFFGSSIALFPCFTQSPCLERTLMHGVFLLGDDLRRASEPVGLADGLH